MAPDLLPGKYHNQTRYRPRAYPRSERPTLPITSTVQVFPGMHSRKEMKLKPNAAKTLKNLSLF